jgi:uncharacterized repeat protein (TIGR03803 family)
MRSTGLGRYALSGGVAVALLAGCGGARPPIGDPGAMPRTSTVAPARLGAGLTRLSRAYQALHRFNLRDGVGSAQSLGGLLSFGGTLYGTTQLGGRRNRGGCCGTVYSITTTGTYTTIYNFRGYRKGDGAAPQAGLIDGGNGLFYGTTASGGTSNHGTVYSVSTTGAEKVLYSFTGGSDGAYPASDLFFYNNTMFGTTLQGGGSGCTGSSGCGTVYSITTSGVETVLYAFKGGTDGATPSSTLIISTHNDAVRRAPHLLYGTTFAGGGTGCGGSGCGTVYTVSTTGQENVVHRFAGGADGSEPQGLVDDRGTLYGTTVAGGTGCGASGCGTVYAYGGSSTRVIYDFRGGSDGSGPNGPLIDIIGTLYGTTARGGRCSGEPCGTVYGLGTAGKKEVWYRFTDSGFSPDGPLANMNVTLYGTTLKGGGSGKGYGRGVIYSLTP